LIETHKTIFHFFTTIASLTNHGGKSARNEHENGIRVA